MVCRNRCAMVLNEGLFFIKYLFVVAVFVAFLWVPNSVFIDYADVSKYLSILFMILQVFYLLREGDNFDRFILHGRDKNGKALRCRSSSIWLLLNIFNFDNLGRRYNNKRIWICNFFKQGRRMYKNSLGECYKFDYSCIASSFTIFQLQYTKQFINHCTCIFVRFISQLCCSIFISWLQFSMLKNLFRLTYWRCNRINILFYFNNVRLYSRRIRSS